MPPHLHYVEPYFGSGAVLFAKDFADTSEVVNDIDRTLSDFWCVLQDPALFTELQRRLEATPFSEAEYHYAHALLAPGLGARSVDRAWAFFVYCRQSLAGRMKSFSGITKTRTRRGMNGEASAWLSAIDGLQAVHDRLKRVVILDARPALGVIAAHDGPQTLYYLDPPYLDTTRTSPDVYAREMTAQDHAELLALLPTLTGQWMLSGYRSELYDTMLASYPRHDFDLPNNAAHGPDKRRMTECLWCNF
jgi:DNA adenine methylase